MNTEWALGELDKYLALVTPVSTPGRLTTTYAGTRGQIVAQLVVVERIWSHVIGPKPPTQRTGHDPERSGREWAIRCRETIVKKAEIDANLGETAPDLNAAQMHPWIWEGAKSLWQSDHFAEAVEAAAKKLNAETQNKVHRRDIAETDLFNQIFTDSPATPGSPRLRLPTNYGGKTAKSQHRGIRAFAEGCFAALRNPLAHEGVELSEPEALEQLAALSILARWVSQADLHEN